MQRCFDFMETKRAVPSRFYEIGSRLDFDDGQIWVRLLALGKLEIQRGGFKPSM